jgi:hypothetical protein
LLLKEKRGDVSSWWFDFGLRGADLGVVESKSSSSRPGGILGDETLVAVVSGLVELDGAATDLTDLVNLRTTLADDGTIHAASQAGWAEHSLEHVDFKGVDDLERPGN